MSHQIEDTDSLFSVRQPTWHGLGTVLSDYPDRATAQALAHPWEPVTEPVFRRVPTVDSTGYLRETYEELPGSQAVVRSDNGATLGVTSSSLVPVSNDDMWSIAEALQNDSGGRQDVMFETAGSLRGGAQVWILIRLREAIALDGDPNGATLPYYVLQNSHDGSGSFRGQGTNVRVICANTSHMADLDARSRGTEFIFRHTKNIHERVEEARQALAGWRSSIDDWRLYSEEMLGLTVTDEEVEAFLERFIPAPPPSLASDRVMRNVEEARATWRGCLNSSTCEGINRTAYGLVQASSEYSEHYRAARTEESRFKRAWLSSNEVMTSASKLAREASGALA